MQKNLKIRFSIPGFHYWPNVPEKYKYLGSSHRHMFYWTIRIPIDTYRQIEFIEMKDKIFSLICKEYKQKGIGLENHVDFTSMSCEEIAIATQKLVKKELNIECNTVEVSEDGENSAEIIWA